MKIFARTGYVAVFLVLLVSSVSFAHADQGGFANSGGSASGGAGVVISSTVASPAGAVNLNCPATGAGGCTGGSFSFASTDGTTSISATFTSGTATESCSGGGKGGHITCGYSLTAYFSGTLTTNGALQAIVGTTSQSFTVGYSATGSTGYNSAYSPFYYSDGGQILRSDDLLGTNQIAFGTQGGAIGQFYGAYGIAVDSAGRIYVADTYNCRVVRFDDMQGTNWTSYGTCGSGIGQFYDPYGIAVDSTGEIYVMDTGNSRLVRIGDMSGTNWTSFNNVGPGTGQLASFVSVAVDASRRIYVADTGDLRIVRMDDIAGTNWTTLTQSQPVNGVIRTFSSPAAVAVDSAGKIYVADNEYYAPAVVRVDDMTGTNWTSVYVSPTGSTGLNSISVDASGAVYTGGGGARIIDDMLGVLTSSGAIAPYGTYYVFGVTPVPMSGALPSAISVSPANLTFSQNVGTQSPAQTVTVTNFGGAPLNLANVAASSPFSTTSNCPSQLQAGSNCAVSVTFTPTVTGPANGTLTLTDDSGNAGTTQTITLTGTGTAPGASVSPASLSFSRQVVGATSATKNIVVTSNGKGPLQIAGVGISGSFGQSGNCIGTIAPGSTCTIQVTFSPVALGAAAGRLTITDNAGTQIVALSGTGVAPVTVSPASLSFGKVKVGTSSLAKNVVLTNNQGVSLSFSSIATTTAFTIATNNCGTSIGAGGKCTVGVKFSPTATGAIKGTLTFIDNASNSPQIATLSGTGY